MFYPTLPEDTQDFGQVLSGVGRSLRDISRGVSYYPYDLLGSGVDVANLALGAVGLGSERPVLGSDYLRNIARSLGMAQEPTGSATENITRLAAGLTNPMAGARAVGRVGDITTEQANRAADALVRQITGNPQATAPQVLQETAMPFMQAVAPKAPSLEKIYHGTSPQAAKQIEKAGFDITKSADGSVWFTNNPDIGEVSATGKGAVVERLADINKLKLGGWEETDKFSTNELIQKGFDGLRLVDGDTVTYQIFNPEKLKSPVSDKTFTGLLEPKTSKFEMPSFASLRPETTDDVDKIYDYLEKQAKKSGFRAESGASNVSNSRYLTIEKDLGNDEISTIEVRISAHGDRHPFTYATDGKISIDPSRGGVDLETTLWDLQEKGYDLIK
jgi:hypothetical protein